ncbi:MAG: DUF3047 domain-containing protein [Rhodospirillaceae bacterium]|nr:DUF3047 domain-containing protein [Rhodospirillaceae bacterium]
MNLVIICVVMLSNPIAINAGQNNNLSSALVSLGWQEFTFENKSPNKYSTCGLGCIEVISQSSVSMLGRSIQKKLTSNSVLSWEWKILQPVFLSDITLKGSDDRSLALYITFPFDPETASFREKLLRPMVELIEGENAPGRMLSYIWTGYGKADELYKSPFYGGVNVMIVKRNSSDPLNKWQNESVNLVADYQRAFGSKPHKISEILIGADTDDLLGSSIGRLRNLNLSQNR